MNDPMTWTTLRTDGPKVNKKTTHEYDYGLCIQQVVEWVGELNGCKQSSHTHTLPTKKRNFFDSIFSDGLPGGEVSKTLDHTPEIHPVKMAHVIH